MAYDHLQNRVERERQQYDDGLERNGYDSFFSHSHHYFMQRRNDLIKEALQCAENMKALEIGSLIWKDWLDDNEIIPSALHCINISKAELEKGVSLSADSKIKPDFKVMDAHDLNFADNSFDVVFGGGILHHLELETAIKEIWRVTKPTGKIVFVEPLDINPISKLVRALTPFARTKDERALRFKDLRAIENRFKTKYHFEELFSVPTGVLSRYLFNTPSNWLMQSAFKVDVALSGSFIPLRYLYRHVMIIGLKDNTPLSL